MHVLGIYLFSDGESSDFLFLSGLIRYLCCFLLGFFSNQFGIFLFFFVFIGPLCHVLALDPSTLVFADVPSVGSTSITRCKVGWV